VEAADFEPGSDAEVMVRARAEPRWFAVVFDRHFLTIHRYLSCRVGSESADDLAGEVFRVAFERRDSFDPVGDSARPWLYGIATNLVHRERRSEGRRLRAFHRLAARPSVPAREDSFELVDERLDAEAAARTVALAVTRLPHADRDALVLFAVEGLTYSEVAAALAIPIGTVRSRISRARLRLRELLDDSGQQEVVWIKAEEPRDG
jgi:RNA polymerase sigma factor (sigma-70 family)